MLNSKLSDKMPPLPRQKKFVKFLPLKTVFMLPFSRCISSQRYIDISIFQYPRCPKSRKKTSLLRSAIFLISDHKNKFSKKRHKIQKTVFPKIFIEIFTQSKTAQQFSKICRNYYLMMHTHIHVCMYKVCSHYTGTCRRIHVWVHVHVTYMPTDTLYRTYLCYYMYMYCIYCIQSCQFMLMNVNIKMTPGT